MIASIQDFKYFSFINFVKACKYGSLSVNNVYLFLSPNGNFICRYQIKPCKTPKMAFDSVLHKLYYK